MTSFENTSTLNLLDKPTFEYLAHFVRERSAIVLEPGKAYLLESRLMPIAAENSLNTLAELAELLKRPGNLHVAYQVVNAITTNETSFFRDLHPFEALRTHIIPDLIQRRKDQRTLHIWSNACSSGQEAFSIAMILQEDFPDLLENWKVRIIATDLSTSVLKRAKDGVFNQTEVNRGLPKSLLNKYFSQEGSRWRISDTLRRRVEFRELNLIQRWPATLPLMDIIFLRNVLIYFDPATKTDVLTRTAEKMRPDGYLFLGGAETTMNLHVPFMPHTVGKATCFRLKK